MADHIIILGKTPPVQVTQGNTTKACRVVGNITGRPPPPAHVADGTYHKCQLSICACWPQQPTTQQVTAVKDFAPSEP